MLADVQASGFTPISWLRFSSRTALTTTCTASNIRAADSWGGGQRWGRRGKRQLSQGTPKPPWCYPRALRQRPSQEREPSRPAVRTGLWGSFSVNQMAVGKMCVLPTPLWEQFSPSHVATSLFGKGHIREGLPGRPAGSPPQGDVCGPEGVSRHLRG